MGKLFKGLLSPFVFVQGTAEPILSGAVDILQAASVTILGTATGGFKRVAELWGESSPSPSDISNGSSRSRSDPFRDLKTAVESATAGYSRNLIDNAEQIQRTIKLGAEAGVDQLVVQCTKKFGAELEAGLPIKGLPIQIKVLGTSKKGCLIEITYKPDTWLEKVLGRRRKWSM